MSPLVRPTAETSATMQDTPPPLHLLHESIVMVPYAPFDGPYRADTDAKYLSIGIAQWNEDGGGELSAKVFRHSGNKWSRQSEELPLHRLVDLCIFMVDALYRSPQNTATMTVEGGTFEYQSQAIELRRMTQVPAAFEEMRPLVQRRLRKLRDLLNATGLD